MRTEWFNLDISEVALFRGVPKLCRVVLHDFGERGVQLELGRSAELEFRFLNAETGGNFFCH